MDPDELMMVIAHKTACCVTRGREAEICVLATALLAQAVAVAVTILYSVVRGLPFRSAALWLDYLRWFWLSCVMFFRDAERRADRLRLLLAAKADVDVTSGRRAMEKFAEEATELPWWISTHPPIESRVHEMLAVESEARLYLP